jgi:signal transduction histidine kinase
VLFALQISAQQNARLDSLLKMSRTDKGSVLVHAFTEISWEYRSINSDSSVIFAKKALQVAESIKDNKSIAAAYNSIASSFEAVSKLDSALMYHEKSLKLKREINDTIGIADTYNNLGIVYDTQGDYVKALKNYFEALKIYESYSKEFQKVPMVYVNIGIVYKKQKEYNKVLEYYQKALKIYQDNDYKIGEVITTGNIGSVLLSAENYEESIEYSIKARELYTQLGYNRYEAYMDINIAIAKDSMKLHTQARPLYLNAVKAFKEDRNLYELANAKIALAHNYSTSLDFLKAKRHLQEALQITQQNKFKEIEIKGLKQLAEVAAKTGDFSVAFKSYKNYAVEKDSIFKKEKTQTIFELETKYETEKKEKEILVQRADIAEKELKLSKKNTQLIGLGVLAIVFGLLGYLFYNQQKLKNTQLKKENELKDALLKIETQNRLQEQRLRISRDLHDNIGAQLTFIISSLDNLKYGFKIPGKLETKLGTISKFTTNTIYELRDTIWAMNKSEITFEDLQSRISNFINAANLSTESTAFSFMVDKELEKQIVFTSVEGMNLYRIIQEAINNAIKYAESTQVEVLISKQNSNLEIVIKDNGKGFNMKNIELGNGINNIKKRATELKAELLIESDQKKGTNIQLVMTTNT